MAILATLFAAPPPAYEIMVDDLEMALRESGLTVQRGPAAAIWVLDGTQRAPPTDRRSGGRRTPTATTRGPRPAGRSSGSISPACSRAPRALSPAKIPRRSTRCGWPRVGCGQPGACSTLRVGAAFPAQVVSVDDRVAAAEVAHPRPTTLPNADSAPMASCGSVVGGEPGPLYDCQAAVQTEPDRPQRRPTHGV
jgi:hypothetical protein